MTDLTVINGKTLGGVGGEGILIEEVTWKFDTKQDGTDVVSVELMGTAYTVLKDSYNPKAGYSELPEPIPVSHRISVAVSEDDKIDNNINFSQLNRAFNLKEPLVDRIGETDRLLKDADNSVVAEIEGKQAYFAAKVAKGKTGEKLSEYYFNIIGVAQRVEATKSAVAAKLDAIRQKKAEAARKLEEAMA
jgi:hypothetical protein